MRLLLLWLSLNACVTQPSLYRFPDHFSALQSLQVQFYEKEVQLLATIDRHGARWVIVLIEASLQEPLIRWEIDGTVIKEKRRPGLSLGAFEPQLLLGPLQSMYQGEANYQLRAQAGDALHTEVDGIVVTLSSWQKLGDCRWPRLIHWQRRSRPQIRVLVENQSWECTSQ